MIASIMTSLMALCYDSNNTYFVHIRNLAIHLHERPQFTQPRHSVWHTYGPASPCMNSGAHTLGTRGPSFTTT